MSIADKLTTIAENEQRVYDKGVADGNMLPKITSWYYMFATGVRNEWLPYIKYNDTSNVTDMSYAFYSNKDITELPEINTGNVTDFTRFCMHAEYLKTIPALDFSKGTTFIYAFGYCNRLDNIPDLDLSSATNLQYMFSNCTGLHYVGKLKTSNCTSFYYMFHYCSYMVEIKEIDLTSATSVSNMFYNCVNLKRVTFKGSISVSLNLSASTYLTRETIMSAINALSGDVTEKTLTLNKTAVNKAFETSNGAADGTTSTEWAELIATKSNWTISLA